MPSTAIAKWVPRGAPKVKPLPNPVTKVRKKLLKGTPDPLVEVLFRVPQSLIPAIYESVGWAMRHRRLSCELPTKSVVGSNETPLAPSKEPVISPPSLPAVPSAASTAVLTRNQKKRLARKRRQKQAKLTTVREPSGGVHSASTQGSETEMFGKPTSTPQSLESIRSFELLEKIKLMQLEEKYDRLSKGRLHSKDRIKFCKDRLTFHVCSKCHSTASNETPCLPCRNPACEVCANLSVSKEQEREERTAQGKRKLAAEVTLREAQALKIKFDAEIATERLQLEQKRVQLDEMRTNTSKVDSLIRLEAAKVQKSSADLNLEAARVRNADVVQTNLGLGQLVIGDLHLCISCWKLPVPSQGDMCPSCCVAARSSRILARR